MNRKIISRLLPSYKNIIRQKQNVAATEEVIEYADDEEEAEREKLIELKRNKSRLLPQHRNMLLNKVPYEESQSWIHETVKYKRALYGKYGSSSNVNPSICWPDKVDMDDTLEYERVKYPETIQQLMHKVAEQKRLKVEAVRARDEEVAAKVAKLDEWKLKLQEKIAKAEADAKAAKVLHYYYYSNMLVLMYCVYRNVKTG